MGVAPNFGTEIDGREDGRGVYPDVMEDVGPKWSDEMKGMGVEVGNAGDVAEEISFDKLLLWNPKFLTSVVDDSVLVRVAVGDKGAGGGGEEVGEDVG